jgi:hypothetical protein
MNFYTQYQYKMSEKRLVRSFYCFQQVIPPLPPQDRDLTDGKNIKNQVISFRAKLTLPNVSGIKGGFKNLVR